MHFVSNVVIFLPSIDSYLGLSGLSFSFGLAYVFLMENEKDKKHFGILYSILFYSIPFISIKFN